MKYYLNVLKKYAVFKGRASRSEYWYFTLFNMLASVVIFFIDILLGTGSLVEGYGLLFSLYTLAVLIPGLSVFVRRLHDTNRSGWWFFLAFVPLIGGIVLFVFMLTGSTPGKNQYGEQPAESK